MAYVPDPYCVLTMNCRGLNIPERRTQLLQDLFKHRISMAFLQETHFKEGSAPLLKSKHYPNAICSNHPTACKVRVAILLEAKLQFHEMESARQEWQLSSFTEGTLILGGDFNVPLHPLVDQSTGHSSNAQGALRSMQKSLQNLRLVDCWRSMHPGDKESHYSVVHRRYSRIDYIFLQQEQLASVQKVKIGAALWSDHCPVTLELDSDHCLGSSQER
ncbi:Hypothetical predicted protein [Pelobates cultripes]|uniref:exodeoxyribonuclease III n=1 Tax=Pelobates cultripes TaxID=61616 RepID=A0AAD1SYB8_PELCU|nr:Hypothetical predicted protein [Pelobates cultripes]